MMFLPALLLLVSQFQLGAAATSGSIKTLLYNVAGLPEALSSSKPAENTPYISQRLSGYGLINVQEDFNSHAALYASDAHPYRTATSGGVPLGDGLNTLSNYPFLDFTRTAWDNCNLNSGDCLTPKGFTAMRIQIDTNQWVDVYNLHTDAGSDSGDRSARAGNVAQILKFMETFSAGMPVIVMGDTNMRYTTTGDSIRTLVAGGNAASTHGAFTDAWVSTSRSGTPPAIGGAALTCPFPFASTVTDQATMLACEVVDKILVRSKRSALNLSITSLTNEHRTFLHPTTGVPLSDHYPLSAAIAWTSAPNLRLSPVVGGPHGDYFHDIPALTAVSTLPSITTITLAGSERLDSITAAYSGISSIKHGGTGGKTSSLTLNSGETITQVYACQGEKDGRTRVFHLKITTSSGRTLAVGQTTASCTTISAPDSGWRAVGFWGRAGNEIDRIGVVWGK